VDPNVFGPILGVLFIATIVVASIVFHFSRSASLLDGWAEREGVRIVSQEKCWFFKGPFFWTTGKGQDVYYVTVEDRSGRTRTAYVRVGGLFLGMFSDNVEVRWES
jgi:hypothetical protein